MKEEKTAVVEVKSPWASRTSWLQVVSVVVTVTVAVAGVIDITEDMRVLIIAGANFFSAIATIVLKTWFTNTVASTALK